MCVRPRWGLNWTNNPCKLFVLFTFHFMLILWLLSDVQNVGPPRNKQKCLPNQLKANYVKVIYVISPAKDTHTWGLYSWTWMVVGLGWDRLEYSQEKVNLESKPMPSWIAVGLLGDRTKKKCKHYFVVSNNKKDKIWHETSLTHAYTDTHRTKIFHTLRDEGRKDEE